MSAELREVPRQTAEGPLAMVHRGLFLLLSSFLLFAHGCHSDKDTELLDRFTLFAANVCDWLGL